MSNDKPQQNQEIGGTRAAGVGGDAINSPMTTGDTNTLHIGNTVINLPPQAR